MQSGCSVHVREPSFTAREDSGKNYGGLHLGDTPLGSKKGWETCASANARWSCCTPAGTWQMRSSVSESWRNRQMLAKSGQKTALAGDWPKAIASQGWLNEGRRRGDIASASPAPMTDIANILRRNGQFSSGTSLHSVKQAPACWGLRPQSPKREASADKATAAPHVAAALCQAQGWLPRISPILNVPSPADWRNLDATAVLIARPSPKLPRGPETLMRRQSSSATCPPMRITLSLANFLAEAPQSPFAPEHRARCAPRFFSPACWLSWPSLRRFLGMFAIRVSQGGVLCGNGGAPAQLASHCCHGKPSIVTSQARVQASGSTSTPSSTGRNALGSRITPRCARGGGGGGGGGRACWRRARLRRCRRFQAAEPHLLPLLSLCCVLCRRSPLPRRLSSKPCSPLRRNGMPTTPAWAAASPSPPSPWARATRAGCPVRGVHRGGARQRAAPHAMHSIELQHSQQGMLPPAAKCSTRHLWLQRC